MPDNKPQRFHSMDFLRASMMGLGVVLHAAQFYLTMPVLDYYWDPARSVSMDALLIFINTFRMPTFYLLSGFFIAMLFTRRGLHGMMQNRRQRLLIPFVVFLPILALLMTVLRIAAYSLMETGKWGFDPGLVPTRQLWDNTHNLWFLYYLLMYVGSVWLLAQITRRLPQVWRARLTAGVLQRPLHSLPVILAAALALAALGSLHESGRVSANLSFVPDFEVYGYFGLCFLLGWMLYHRPDDLDLLARRCWKYMALALLGLTAALGGFAGQGSPTDERYGLFHSLLAIGTGFSVVFFMLSLVGLFVRYASDYNPWIRYFSDSAYWVFILHSIPMVIIALTLYHWEVAAEVKFLLVYAATFLVCLVSYQYFVRNTFIGEMLNGRRYDTVPWR